jgi:hypothetical protein
LAKAHDKEIVVGDLMGLVHEVKAKELQDGTPSLAFIGSFESVNAQTGEILRSGVCYLPSALSGLAVTIARNLQAENALPEAFAVRLVAFPAANPIGYSYKAENLAPQTSTDPLAMVKQAISAGGAKPLAIQHKK